MKEFIDCRKIEGMEMWDRDYIDLIEPGHFLFEKDGPGEFVCGIMRGFMDCRYDKAALKIKFSWQGVCESDNYCGRNFAPQEL